jgi:hypothetical protein
MILDREWRQRDLARRARSWEPLIGKEATVTAAQGRWLTQAGTLLGILWVVVTIGLQVIKWTGVPIAVVVILCWPVILYCLIQGARLSIRAQRQAGAVAGTSAKARPPVNSLQSFQRWSQRSEYSRLRAGQQ